MDMTSSVAAAVIMYLSSAFLLCVGALAFSGVVRSALTGAARAPERWLVVGWVLLALAVLSPSLWRLATDMPSRGAAVEVWNGPSISEGADSARVSIRWPVRTDAVAPSTPVSLRQALGLGLVLVATGVLFSLTMLILRHRRLGRLCQNLPVIRRIGRVRLCASDEALVPFAARARAVAYIVVPTSLLHEPRRLRLVVGHEAHHHRRGDLYAAAVFGVLRALYFWNPLIARWERAMAELEDVACDRHVLERPDVSPFEYGRTLLWAAQSIQGRRYLLSGVRGMADGGPLVLRRRIEMLDQQRVTGIRIREWCATTAILSVMLGASWVAHGAVADYRVTRAEVDAWAARIENRSGFPMPVDDRVVARLNGWVADPARRQFMKAAMERMPGYRSMIETTLHAHGLPTELVGMVMAESAFDNDAQPNTPLEVRSAGIWQIIPGTARRLGLEVSPAADERFDAQKSTEAAAVFLTDLYARYRDWPVAIAAYNAGERKIDAIAAGATSAPEIRARVLAGDEEHARYVRAVIGAIILIDNPSLLE
jgi:membrane-bound lytic murein transglycosylase D